MLHTILALISIAVWPVVCVFALWKGDRPERLAAALLLISWLSSIVIWRAVGRGESEFAVFAIDLIVTAVLALIAWKTTRSWPVWIVAFQVIGLSVHISRFLGLNIGNYAYIAAVNLSAFGVAASLAVGAWFAWREREALKPAGNMRIDF